MFKRFSLLAVGLLSTACYAVPPSYTVTWGVPTQNTDSTTIVGAITYQLYVGPSGQEVKYKTPVTAPPYVLVPTPAAGQTCVQVTATVNGVESALSPEVCAVVPVAKPNPPAPVTASVK